MAGSEQSGPGIQVVSDVVVLAENDTFREEIEGLLGAEYTVSSFADVPSAFGAILAVRPLAVIMSADDTAGKLLESIHGDERIRQTPTLVVSVEGSVAHRGLLDAGANDYVTRPLNHTELLVRVKNLVRTRQLERECEVLSAKFQRTSDKLEELVVTDTLTNTGNRRAFDGTLVQELARSRRAGKPLSLLMIDIDLFKRFNDRYGHKAGDQCLVGVAEELLEAAQRPADYVARFGSEEFAVILPDTDGEGGVLVANRIIEGLEKRNIPYDANEIAKHVTVSMGITEAGPIDSAEELVERSIEALRKAKSQGRNRAVRWTADARVEDTVLEMLD